jgi:23S rRNA pseudoU1915 N3-methylase RlmH
MRSTADLPMIAKGNFHAHGVKLAGYMMHGKSGERAELVEMRGFAAGDLRTAFRDIEIMGRDGTNAETAFFHTYVRLPSWERLDALQWTRTVADRIEKALGFDGQARAISFHTDIKTGERHMHMAWSRITQNAEGELHAIDPGLYKNKLKHVSRELEKELGLKVLDNDRQPGNRARAADRREFEESRRLETSINDIRTAILDSFSKSDSGRSFAAAMKAQGYELANGDRRDNFVVIDHAGGHHALNKKLTGKTLAEIRTRLSDLDRSQLPTVDQAKEIQIDRKAVREALQAREAAKAAIVAPRSNTPSHGPENGRSADKRPLPELGRTAGEIRLAWRLTGSGQQFAKEIERRGMELVHVSREQADASHRAHVFTKSINRQRRELREGFGVVDQRGNVTRIDQRVTGDLWEEIQKRIGGINKDELLTVDQARDLMRHRNREEFRQQKQAERDAARPATAIERKILDAAAHGEQKFSAELAKEGIGLARVTAADVKALDALRKDEAITAAIDPTHKERFIPQLEQGELAAVDKFGSVHKLNPHHMAAIEILAAGDPQLPSVTELRAGFESDKALRDQFFTAIKDGVARDRQERATEKVTQHQERAANRTVREVVGKAERGAMQPIAGAGKVADKVFSFVTRGFSALLKIQPLQILDLFDFAPAPRLTKAQLHQQKQAAGNLETLHAEAFAAHTAENAAEKDEQIFRADQEQQLPLAAPSYFRPIVRSADPVQRQHDRDEGRERERERE